MSASLVHSTALRGSAVWSSHPVARAASPKPHDVSSMTTPRAALAPRVPQLVAALRGAFTRHASGPCAAGVSGRSVAVGLSSPFVTASPGARAYPSRLPAPCSTARTATPEPVAHEASAAEWQQRSPEVIAAVDGNPTGMQLTFLGTGATVLTPGRHACWTPTPL